jgi:hypothetical protein
VHAIELPGEFADERGGLAVMSSELGSIAQNANSRWQPYCAS